MKNPDGTVTVKTPGKVASTPVGSGTGQVRPLQAKSSVKTSVVVKQPGRGPAPRSARSR